MKQIALLLLMTWGLSARLAWCDAAENARSVMAKAPYVPAVFAIYVLDPETSSVVFEHNAGYSVVPASCMKAITTAAALHTLGPDHRFRTTLEAAGEVDTSGVLHGDLVIRGGGDPTLGSSRVDGSLTSPTLFDGWVEAVQRAGIREITGAVLGDDSYLPWDSIPGEWTWSDIGNYYGAGTYGLCFNDNLYVLTLRPGASVGAAAGVIGTEPATPEITWHNEMKTGPPGSGDNGYIYGAPGEAERVLRGTVQIGPPFNIKGSLPDPALTVARMLEDRLETTGIVVTRAARSTHGSRAPGGKAILAKIESPPVRAIVRALNKQSFNLYPEMLLMHMAARTTGSATRSDAIAGEEQWLRSIGIDLTGVHILDGSGLSRNNLVTARAMAQLAAAMKESEHGRIWRDSLPNMGVDGDLRSRETTSPLKGRVQAKTGYIERVRGLCGYLQAKSGRDLCFGIIVNGYENKMREIDRDIDAILRGFYEEN